MFDHSGIWLGDTAEKDSYRDFLCKFTLSTVGKLTLKVSADSKFVCFLNGALCGFGECADFPSRREYYTFDISRAAVTGENELAFTVWHLGEGSSTYIVGDAFLAFAVECEGKTVASSDGRGICKEKSVLTFPVAPQDNLPARLRLCLQCGGEGRKI